LRIFSLLPPNVIYLYKRVADLTDLLYQHDREIIAFVVHLVAAVGLYTGLLALHHPVIGVSPLPPL